ncbi:MAG TPA: hypothetical protein VEO54_31330 [Thermoanaerobaculia bacterium]|nr:hypothetical protein [Thermoanaerobaculia bacterium]
MSSRSALILAWTVILGWSGLAAEPRELRSANAAVHAPLWVPESVALHADKTLDTTKFDRRFVQSLEHRQRRQSPPDMCVMEPAVEHYKPNTTLPDLVQSALDVVAGHVVQTESGFWKGVPATLLTIEITDRLKWSGNFESPARIRAPYPAGRIVTATGVFCGIATLTTLVPRSGDPVLLFVLTPPADAERSVAEPAARRELFFQQGSTVLGAPEVVKARDLAALVDTTRRLIALQDDELAEAREQP